MIGFLSILHDATMFIRKIATHKLLRFCIIKGQVDRDRSSRFWYFIFVFLQMNLFKNIP